MRKLAFALLATAVSGAFAPTVHAAHEDDSFGHMACVLTDVTGGASPAMSPLVDDALDLDLLDVKDGNLVASGSLTCSGADTAGADKPVIVPLPENMHITITGHYDSLSCGTFVAHGNASIEDTGDDLSVGITGTVGIDFVASQGTLAMAIENGAIRRRAGGPTNVIHSGRGDAALSMTPTQGSDCPATGVSSFMLNGALALKFGGDAADDDDSHG
jgi:hypothetical protein